MLEKIREGSQGTWAIVILGLVILSFVFAGVGGYVSSSGSAAAEVNGDEISQSTFDRAYENERARLESQFGDAFAALAADSAYLNQFRQSVLDRLIADKLIEQAARELGLRVSNQQVREQILLMPEFQIGGQFNNARFQATLRSVGFQTNTFRDYMRNEMTRQQVARALLGSEFSLPSEASKILQLQQQTRDIQYLTVPYGPFEAGVELTEDDIKDYYQQNLLQFDTQERLSLEYLEVKAEDYLDTVEVTEQELVDLYERSSNDYRSEEQRRVSHILVEFGDDQDSAQAKAQEAADRVNAGEEFAVVAGEMSDDTFSAENGGDLDFFTRGVMDSAFEEAAFALANIGDVSGVVESEFGFHVIKLTDIKAEQVTAFEEVKDDLEQRVKLDKAVEELYIVQGQLAELAFEMPDSLQDVAAATGLSVQATELFVREQAPEAVSNPIVIAQAFSDELIQDRVNSEVITVGENHFMVIRVKEHEPERTKALEEVRDQIVSELTSEKAQEAAKEWTNDLLAQLQAGQDISAGLAEKEIGWQLQAGVTRFGGEVPRAIVDKAFQLSTDAGANQDVVELASGDIGIVQLNNVNASDELPAEQLEAMQQRLGQTRSQSLYASLIESLRADADITVFNL
ncbi:SurA N-terminal domain-containing protein [Aliiglaciecola sp. M165]|uniref:SurA N-terminal domain-containing protein n=1 Tax=Aliiglaciecola sp. M165 TaxID=2593649 RepID=UPI0011800D43|nr:SurA N-terminal domain-containing protein [Aliiglaciecola sp. M165]TRY29601.1 peptidylprolyl isomerase [Aliiglaciecola sp. M165]